MPKFPISNNITVETICQLFFERIFKKSTALDTVLFKNVKCGLKVVAYGYFFEVI